VILTLTFDISRRRCRLVYYMLHVAKQGWACWSREKCCESAVAPNASSPRILSRMSWCLTQCSTIFTLSFLVILALTFDL